MKSFRVNIASLCVSLLIASSVSAQSTASQTSSQLPPLQTPAAIPNDPATPLPSGTVGTGVSSVNIPVAPTPSIPAGPPLNSSSAGSPAPIASDSGYRMVAYFADWVIYARNYQVSDIPVDKLTHILYAFAKPDASGKVTLGDSYADIEKSFPGDSWDTAKQAFRGNLWQLNKVVKPKHPRLKTLLSVGGWTWSGPFSDIAASEATRKVFADSCLELVTTYAFDGIDIDWEYPVLGGLETNKYRPDDGKNLILLFKAVREAFDAAPNGKSLLVTAAGPAGLDKLQHWDMNELDKYLDFITVMTYDFRGGWSAQTGHMTNLYEAIGDPEVKEKISADVAIQYYIKNGMPSNKICMGAALYGRGWNGVGSQNNGLYQKFTSVPKGTWDDASSGNTGVFDYKDLLTKMSTGGYIRHWDDKAKAPYVYNSGTQQMISYEDMDSIKAKVSYIQQQKLGGIMFWELSGDTKDDKSLVGTAHTALQGTSPSIGTTQPAANEDQTFQQTNVDESVDTLVVPDEDENSPTQTAGAVDQSTTQPPPSPVAISDNQLPASNSSIAPVPQNIPENDAADSLNKPQGLGDLVQSIANLVLPLLGNNETENTLPAQQTDIVSPSSSLCLAEVATCNSSVDLFSCIGSTLAACNQDNRWDVLACPQGKRCGFRGGQVGCLSSSASDSNIQFC
ncbi:hypothetical protein MP228_003193 [Amoeboaphelidium protococcarum]|nr:hypothetical protein MP228_003193 [Amoeboaphelidium protococcarum]